MGPTEFVVLPRGKLDLEGQTVVNPHGPWQALSCEEVGQRTREEIKVKIVSSPDRKIQSPFAATVRSTFCVLLSGGWWWCMLRWRYGRAGCLCPYLQGVCGPCVE